MEPKREAAGLRTRAAFNDECSRKRSAFRACLKAFILAAACWGLLPIRLADWLIRKGLRHA